MAFYAPLSTSCTSHWLRTYLLRLGSCARLLGCWLYLIFWLLHANFNFSFSQSKLKEALRRDNSFYFFFLVGIWIDFIVCIFAIHICSCKSYNCYSWKPPTLFRSLVVKIHFSKRFFRNKILKWMSNYHVCELKN